MRAMYITYCNEQLYKKHCHISRKRVLKYLPKTVKDAQAKVGSVAVDPKVHFRQRRVHVDEVQARAALHACVVASE